MVSFARARTRSLLSRLWPVTEKALNNQTLDSHKSKKLIEDIAEQNKCFLEASKNGGMWFS
ncbi:hypothetical protein [Prochlorococcus marinus]|uniref:hypothetical protein n=1 Tax=Prochlorococcus marinus TaxID=1219 RepID=UPI0022B5AE10|nr:hypothetical protein [Prochlorococcus marinus]